MNNGYIQNLTYQEKLSQENVISPHNANGLFGLLSKKLGR